MSVEKVGIITQEEIKLARPSIPTPPKRREEPYSPDPINVPKPLVKPDEVPVTPLKPVEKPRVPIPITR